MKVAITLLTCGRAEYTKLTLESLAKYNDLDRFVLMHGIDYVGDGREENRALADSHGFETVVHPHKRLGNALMIHRLFEQAEKAGVDMVLLLENDWESLKPIDWDMIEALHSDDAVYCARLYGAYKGEGNTLKAHPGHAGRNDLFPTWERWRDGWEVGDIHWAHPPSITKIDRALFVATGVRRGHESMVKSGKLTELTARPVGGNIMFHIGVEKTSDFRD